MIEYGNIKRNKGSPLQADLSYEMRFVDESNLDEMMDLQEIVIHHLADKEIFRIAFRRLLPRTSADRKIGNRRLLPRWTNRLQYTLFSRREQR